MAYKRGVYNSELPTSLTTPVQSAAGLQVVLGTAPIHLSDDPETAANTPKLCYSFPECVAAVGYSDDFKQFTLCQSIDASFRVFNVAPVILINVLDPSNANHTSTNGEESFPVVDKQVIYDVPNVLMNTMTVKNDGVALEPENDFIAERDANGNIVITLISVAAQAAASLSIGSTSINPAGVTPADIVGGVNAATGKETGLELLRQIYPKFGLVPGQVIAPGWSQHPVVAAAIQAKVQEINGVYDCFCHLDIAADASGAIVYTEVKNAKEAMGASSARSAALWPMVAVGKKVYYYSAMLAALTAFTDAGNGDVPYASPSNKDLRITGTVLKDGTPVVLDQEQGNLLAGQGVITAINLNGFKAWGNNTAAFPSTTDPKDRWLPVRRFIDWDGNNFILTYIQKIDNPANIRLIQDIVDSQNIIGNGFVARGYCGSYRMEFREDENPVTELLNGILTVHTMFSPFPPAEVIKNIREYDVNGLLAAMTGGA